jgi:hypothetical protein
MGRSCLDGDVPTSGERNLLDFVAVFHIPSWGPELSMGRFGHHCAKNTSTDFISLIRAHRLLNVHCQEAARDRPQQCLPEQGSAQNVSTSRLARSTTRLLIYLHSSSYLPLGSKARHISGLYQLVFTNSVVLFFFLHNGRCSGPIQRMQYMQASQEEGIPRPFRPSDGVNESFRC